MHSKDSSTDFILPTMGDISFGEANDVEEDPSATMLRDGSGGADDTLLPSAEEVMDCVRIKQTKLANAFLAHIGTALRNLYFTGSLSLSKMVESNSGLEDLPISFYPDIIVMMQRALQKKGFEIEASIKNCDQFGLSLCYEVSFCQPSEPQHSNNDGVDETAPVHAEIPDEQENASLPALEECRPECPPLAPTLDFFPRRERCKGRDSFGLAAFDDEKMRYENCTLM